MEELEELEELGFIGVLEVMEDCESPEYEVLNREFATVLVDNLLDFLSSI
jgi:hypothetical protein